MDTFAVAFAVIAAIILGGIVIGGLAALLQTRTARRDRLEMKRHVRRVELSDRCLRFRARRWPPQYAGRRRPAGAPILARNGPRRISRKLRAVSSSFFSDHFPDG